MSRFAVYVMLFSVHGLERRGRNYGSVLGSGRGHRPGGVGETRSWVEPTKVVMRSGPMIGRAGRARNGSV